MVTTRFVVPTYDHALVKPAKLSGNRVVVKKDPEKKKA